MAAVLGIHAADINVVSVYEGSTIVDFFVTQRENVEDALDLDRIEETYTEVVADMDEFMGSPVLNAVASGVALITPHGAAGGGGGRADPVFPWDDVAEDVYDEPEEQVAIEVRYRTQVAGGQEEGASGNAVTAYVILLAGMIVMILIVMVALCVYNRVAFKTSIEKTASVAGKLGERRLSLQYEPRKIEDDLHDLVYTSASARGSARLSSRASSRPSSRPLNTYLTASAESEAKTGSGASRLASDIKRLEGGDDSVAHEPVFEDECKHANTSPRTRN
jgi:hypothetical protein